jgi:hypothetical protein
MLSVRARHVGEPENQRARKPSKLARGLVGDGTLTWLTGAKTTKMGIRGGFRYEEEHVVSCLLAWKSREWIERRRGKGEAYMGKAE